MKRFIHLLSGFDVVVEKDPLGEFFAIVPALPGCGSQGESAEDTLLNLDDAIMTVLEVLREDDPNRLQQLCGVVTQAGGVEPDSEDSTAVINTMVSGNYRVESNA